MDSSLLIGVNLSGAEFGTAMIGTYGIDYTYPTHAEIDYFASKGMGIIRLPFMWERLQHTKLGELDAAELARIDDLVSYATSNGLKIIIEPHNFGMGFGALIGTAQTPNSAFADFWGKVAEHFKSNPNVIFGLCNEPNQQTATQWLESANAAIAAIRGAGALQEILVPGSYWTGAWSWTTTDNDTVVGTGVIDPANNFAFEVHQYLDADSSGTQPGAVSPTIGVERLTAITEWAEATGSRLFLGEVGATIDQTSLTALDGMLDYMHEHSGVWEGVTAWSAGPWWGDYMFSLEPLNGADKPQMAIFEQHLDLVFAEDIQHYNLAITGATIDATQAAALADSINTTPQTEIQYVNSLLSKVANTTIPAVAVEASMYGVVGTAAEITLLATKFLPAQVANATAHGYNPLVYACEALGLAFAFGNETGSTAFSANFGPSNPATADNAAFASAAVNAIFGASATPNLVSVMTNFVTNWENFFSSFGIPGLGPANATQVDLAARGTAWGDMVGVALANNLGPLKGQATEFLLAAAQDVASYGVSLVGQPSHHAFEGEL
jgi:aryl-phospho-beta-D-glucosidase BglC (GH1 family)